MATATNTHSVRTAMTPSSCKEGPSSPLFIASVDDPRVAQPVILTSFDSLPSPPMGSSSTTSSTSPNSCASPTSSIYFGEHVETLGEKRKRHDADHFYHLGMSKSAAAAAAEYGSPRDGETSDDSSHWSRKPGPKPMSDGEDLSIDIDNEDPKVKRKVQNRAAQRAFRERKERYVKELESKIKQVQDNHLHATAQLIQENQHLRSIVYRLEAENFALKGIHIQFPIHPSPYPSNTSTTSTNNTTTPHHPHSMLPPPPSTSHHHTTSPTRSSRDVQYTFSISTPATLRPKMFSHKEDREQEAQFTRLLQEQVSNDAIEQLLSQPLFDTCGGLIAPYVTSKGEEEPSNNKLLTCPIIWQRLCKHTRFSYFTMEELCQEVRKHAKCTEEGPAVTEAEMKEILRFMDTKNYKK
ncbi:hypothetical protein BDA99DRAFT_557148 [Phascolomyces articulosus]|uniref:BZIP domain-containing protein n=1 Tax=Phascolomyces articulosus TaxID=60185 RepID=A0AAD5PHA6_9FUNG|nr:hypothetical protein BDA99DRAFT_557148 [Phascolomyces articulosus]